MQFGGGGGGGLRVKVKGLGFRVTHRPLSSSFLGSPCMMLNINHKKELLRGLCVKAGPNPGELEGLELADSRLPAPSRRFSSLDGMSPQALSPRVHVPK